VAGSSTAIRPAFPRGRSRGEELGGGGRGKGADRRVLVVSDCGALVVTGWQAGSRMEMGRGTVEEGRRRGKWAVKPFPF
jgi:hypothetical protein